MNPQRNRHSGPTAGPLGIQWHYLLSLFFAILAGIALGWALRVRVAPEPSNAATGAFLAIPEAYPMAGEEQPRDKGDGQIAFRF